MQNVLAPYTAYSNKLHTNVTEWATSPIRHIGQYLPALDRYYAVQMHNTDDVSVWDSADGITWSAAELVDATATYMTRCVTDGTYLYLCVDAVIYRSTTGLAADLTTFDTINDVPLGLIYDDTNNLFIVALGDDTIETSPDGATWTSRATESNALTGIAHNTATGRTLVYEDVAFDIHYSDNGTTWNTYALAEELDYIFYSEALGNFGAVKASDREVILSTNGAAWLSTGVFADGLIECPEFVMVWDATADHWYALKSSTVSAANHATAITLGPDPDTLALATGAKISASGINQGGAATLIYPDDTGQLVYSQYGAGS
jgi:hypothetical protein